MLSAVAVYKDLFLTQRHFIKGNLSPHVGRLSDYLDHSSEDFVALQDVLLVDLRDGSSTPSPSLLLNPREIVFAHEDFSRLAAARHHPDIRVAEQLLEIGVELPDFLDVHRAAP